MHGALMMTQLALLVELQSPPLDYLDFLCDCAWQLVKDDRNIRCTQPGLTQNALLQRVTR